VLGSLRKGPRCYHTISTFGVKGMAAFSVLRVCHYSCARPHTVQPHQLGTTTSTGITVQPHQLGAYKVQPHQVQPHQVQPRYNHINWVQPHQLVSRYNHINWVRIKYNHIKYNHIKYNHGTTTSTGYNHINWYHGTTTSTGITVQPHQLGAYKVCILCVTSTKVCHVNWLYIEPVYSVTR